MKIAIVSGKDEGPTRLNAFDNALADAGIGDVNLIKVSSMWKKHTLKICKTQTWSYSWCVLSSVTSSKPRDTITAVVAVAIRKN